MGFKVDSTGKVISEGIDLNNNKGLQVGTGTADEDGVNKGQMDTAISDAISGVGGGGVDVAVGGSVVVTDSTELNFINGMNVTDAGSGQADISGVLSGEVTGNLNSATLSSTSITNQDYIGSGNLAGSDAFLVSDISDSYNLKNVSVDDVKDYVENSLPAPSSTGISEIYIINNVLGAGTESNSVTFADTSIYSGFYPVIINSTLLHDGGGVAPNTGGSIYFGIQIANITATSVTVRTPYDTHTSGSVDVMLIAIRN